MSILFYICLQSQITYANEYKLRFIDVKNGLSQNTINKIYEDKFGLIWVATNDGLNRFENGKIEVFYSDLEGFCSLKSDRIVDLKEDNQNRLWLATYETGISFYDYKNNCFNNIEIQYKNNQELIKSIDIDTVESILWVATGGGGIFSYNYSTKRKIDYFNKLDKNIRSTEFKSIKKIGDFVYSGNTKGQIIGLNTKNQKYKVYNVSNSRIMSIESSNNRMLITTESDGFLLFEPSENKISKNITFTNGVKDSVFTKGKSSFKINDSSYVIASIEGISYIDIIKDSIVITKTINSSNSNITYSSFLSVLIDSKGTEWYGSNGTGVYYSNIYFSAFNTIRNKENELTFSSIRSINKIDNELWIGGYSGFNKLDLISKRINSVELTNKYLSEAWELYINSNSIYCFLQDPVNEDIVWIGTEDNGLYKYSKSKKKYKFIEFNTNTNLDKSINSVFVIQEYKKNLILGTSNGVVAFEPKTETFSLIESINNGIGKNSLYVRSMYVDDDLIYCVFEGLGVYAYSFIDATLRPLSDSYPKIRKELFRSSNKIVKFGSKQILCTKEKGIFILNPVDSSYINYNSDNGLNNNCVYEILFDKFDCLWVSTNRGISRINLVNNNVTNFDNRVFDLNSEYNLNASLKHNENSFYFGGTDGLVNFNPEVISNHIKPHKLIVKSVELNYKDSISYYYFVENDTINVNFIDDLIEIELLTDEYFLNNGIRYKYRINGNKWIKGNNKFIRIKNLKRGLNKIEISSISEIGNKNHSNTFYINQDVSLFSLSWIIAIVSTLLLAVIYILYRKLIKKNRKVKLALTDENNNLKNELNLLHNVNNIFENYIAHVIWKVDVDFNLKFYSKNIYKFYGLNQEKPLKSLSEIYLSDDLNELKTEILNLKLFKKKIERKLFHRSHLRTFNNYSDIQLTLVYNEQNKIDSIIGVVLDNREKQKAKQQLIEREELFSTLVSTILEPVLITNWSGEILFANNEAKNVLEINQSEITEKNIFNFLDDSLNHKLRKDIYLVKNGESFEKTQYNLLVNNKVKTIEGNGTQLTYFEKTVFLLTFRDVTQKINLINELTIAKINAERSSELKSMYLSNLTHELKTPINAISGFTDIIISKNTNSNNKSYLESIKSSANLLLQLINDLLFYTKAETGKLELRPVPTNIKTLVLEIENIFNLELEKKNLKFIKSINTNGVEHLLNIDQLKFKQVLINLLNNSIKYTENGKITLSIHLNKLNTTNVNLELIVEDTGRGIPESRLKDIFSAFRQVNITDESLGFGLGLAIVKRILKSMNGTITVESELEKGSKFTVRINDINLVVNNSQDINNKKLDGSYIIERIISNDNKLNYYSYELLDELLLMINGRFTSKLKNIKSNFLLKDINDFAEQLLKIAKEREITFLKVYSEELLDATKTIEVEKINYLLENFYKLVELIKKLMEKKYGN
ncbi:MAG: ATP-binding protein [Candidatus Kapaibacterium sp.]|nr:PAS domain S-box protein [Ignavibacteriota bacterium]